MGLRILKKQFTTEKSIKKLSNSLMRKVVRSKNKIKNKKNQLKPLDEESSGQKRIETLLLLIN